MSRYLVGTASCSKFATTNNHARSDIASRFNRAQGRQLNPLSAPETLDGMYNLHLTCLVWQSQSTPLSNTTRLAVLHPLDRKLKTDAFYGHTPRQIRTMQIRTMQIITMQIRTMQIKAMQI